MNRPKVAYFSMEIAIQNVMPTYSGGLGVLAGDTIRAAADLRVPMVAVTLLHRKGYFRQRLDQKGTQKEEPVEWPVEEYLEGSTTRAAVTIEGRTVISVLGGTTWSVKAVSGCPSSSSTHFSPKMMSGTGTLQTSFTEVTSATGSVRRSYSGRAASGF